MIDQNAIIDIVNENLPVVLPVIASSPVVVKLINSVENVIKTLYMPRFTLRNGKAEVDVEIYRKQKNSEIQNQTFTLYEITKLKNFVNSARFASEELADIDENVKDDNVDFDWMMRFFDAVGNVSNEEMQRLWGKVLAGEIKNPGTCSLRTMDIIRNMTSKEAKTYNRLCQFVLVSGDCYFIFHTGFGGKNEYNGECCDYISKTGLTYSESIIPMIECGLLSVDNDLTTDFKSNNILEIYNKDICCFIIADETKDNLLSIDPYFLTRSGIELFNIISSSDSYKTDRLYPILTFKVLKCKHPELTFSVHKVLGEDEFDPEDMLQNN